MDEAISRAADILKYEPLQEEQRKAIAGFLSGRRIHCVTNRLRQNCMLQLLASSV